MKTKKEAIVWGALGIAFVVLFASSLYSFAHSKVPTLSQCQRIVKFIYPTGDTLPNYRYCKNKIMRAEITSLNESVAALAQANNISVDPK